MSTEYVLCKHCNKSNPLKDTSRREQTCIFCGMPFPTSNADETKQITKPENTQLNRVPKTTDQREPVDVNQTKPVNRNKRKPLR